jgi:hypothetical protein
MSIGRRGFERLTALDEAGLCEVPVSRNSARYKDGKWRRIIQLMRRLMSKN